MNKQLLKIVKEVGSVSELAKLLNVSHSYVSNWVAERKKIPAEKVRLLVALSNGKVQDFDLRPDVFYEPKVNKKGEKYEIKTN